MKSVMFCRVPGKRNLRNRGRNGSWVGGGGHTGILVVSRCVDVEVRSVERDLVAVVRSKFRYWGLVREGLDGQVTRFLDRTVILTCSFSSLNVACTLLYSKMMIMIRNQCASPHRNSLFARSELTCSDYRIINCLSN